MRPYRELWAWLKTIGLSPRMETMAQRIDIENLTSWFISILYCGTSDSMQGPALLDETDPDARWFWIVWDMDHSFKVDWGWEVGDEPWEVDTFYSVLVLAGSKDKERNVKLRSFVLQRLMRRPEYRLYLQERLQEALNHRWTREFLDERLSRYKRLARELGADNSTFEAALVPYFENRGTVLREQMARHGFAGESYAVSVSAPPGCGMEVDGYEYGTEYAGMYFAGSRLSLRPLGSCKRRFSHWRIEGRAEQFKRRRHLSLTVSEALRIEAVLGGEESARGGTGDSELGLAR